MNRSPLINKRLFGSKQGGFRASAADLHGVIKNWVVEKPLRGFGRLGTRTSPRKSEMLAGDQGVIKCGYRAWHDREPLNGPAWQTASLRYFVRRIDADLSEQFELLKNEMLR
jgi:hypothetical protein